LGEEEMLQRVRQLLLKNILFFRGVAELWGGSSKKKEAKKEMGEGGRKSSRT